MSQGVPSASGELRHADLLLFVPAGVLVSGKGTRFILANTEQLHAKIHEMSERIRLLEEALTSTTRQQQRHMRLCQDYQLGQSYPDYMEDNNEHDQEPPHPLLHPDLLRVKSTLGLYTGSADGVAGHAIRREGDAAMDVASNDHIVDGPPSHRERSSSAETGSFLEGSPVAGVRFPGHPTSFATGTSYSKGIPLGTTAAYCTSFYDEPLVPHVLAAPPIRNGNTWRCPKPPWS